MRSPRKSVSAATAASLLGVSCRTIRRMVENGDLEAFRVIRSLRIVEESLSEFQRRAIEEFRRREAEKYAWTGDDRTSQV